MSVAHLSASSDFFRIQFNRNFLALKFRQILLELQTACSRNYEPTNKRNGSPKPQLISLDSS